MAVQNNKTTKKPLNIWKWAFLILVIAIALAIGAFWFYLKNSDSDPYQPVEQEIDSTEIIEAQARLTTASFNELMQTTIGNEAPYQLIIDDALHFTGTLDILDVTVPYQITGLPHVLADGNIAIDITAVELVELSLPVDIVLGLFQNILPDHIPLTVMTDDQQLIVRLDEVSSNLDISMRADTIDLEQDRITVLFDIPVEYLQEQITNSQEQ